MTKKIPFEVVLLFCFVLVISHSMDVNGWIIVKREIQTNTLGQNVDNIKIQEIPPSITEKVSSFSHPYYSTFQKDKITDSSTLGLAFNVSNLIIVQEEQVAFEITLLNNSEPELITYFNLNIFLNTNNSQMFFNHTEVPGSLIGILNSTSWVVNLVSSFTRDLHLDYIEIEVIATSELYQTTLSAYLPVKVISPDKTDPVITIDLGDDEIVSKRTIYNVTITDDFFIRAVYIVEDNDYRFSIQYADGIESNILVYTRYYFSIEKNFTGGDHYGQGNITVMVFDGDFQPVNYTISFQEDTAPPKVKFNEELRMTTGFIGNIHLSWVATDDSPLDHFELYLIRSYAPDELLMSLPSTQTDVIFDLNPDEWYTFRICAFDIYGNKGSDTITFHSAPKTNISGNLTSGISMSLFVIILYIAIRVNYHKLIKKRSEYKKKRHS